MERRTSLIGIIVLAVTFAQIALTGATTYCQDSYGNLTRQDFLTWTCSNCLPLLSFGREDFPLTTYFPLSPNLILKINISVLNISVQYTPEVKNPPHAEVCRKYLSDEECTNWYLCCQAAKQCCEVTQQQKVEKKEGISYCPAEWDGVDCWSPAEANSVTHHKCPSYYVKSNLAAGNPTSRKSCEADGEWFTRPNSSGRPWTNYSDCLVVKDPVTLVRDSIYVGFAFHVLSLAALVIAVALYAVFSSHLRGDSNGRGKFKFNLNINLFIAFIFMGLTSIIWEPVYYLDAIEHPQYNLLQQNTVECRALKVLFWYFRSATFWWLFCEGLYLREILINPMGSAKYIIKHLCIGWGVPIVPTVAWAIVRKLTVDESCWSGMAGDELQFIVIVPCLVALTLNLILLIMVQVELMRHFRNSTDDELVDLVRRGTKVTFSLIPIFGVQILVLSYRPENWLPYDIIASVVVGIQGFLVALMYCFVTKEIRVAYAHYKRKMSVSVSSSSGRTTKTRLSTSSGRNDSIPMHDLETIGETGNATVVTDGSSLEQVNPRMTGNLNGQ